MNYHVIIFIGTLQSGGAERVVSEIFSLLADHISCIEIITYYDREIFYKVSNKINVISIEKNTQTKSVLINAVWFRKYINHRKPDIVISFLSPLNIFCVLSLIGINIPIIVCERSDPRYSPKNYFIRKIRNLSYSIADYVIFQTEESRSYFSHKIRHKSTVIPNPCFICEEKIGKALHVPKKNKLVSIGRLIESKNHQLLIKVFKKVHDEYPDYSLYVYGEGPYREKLEKLISELLMQEFVKLPGNIQNIHEEILDAKIFILTSNYEGMPNVLMEAMALGLPVISTQVSGTNMLVDNKINGFTIPIKDEDALFVTIQSLIENDRLREYVGNNAKNKMCEFNIYEIGEKWLDLIVHIISKK